MQTKLNAYQEVVDPRDIRTGMVPDVLRSLLDYLKLEIVRENTPDYITYEIRPRSDR